MTTSLAGSAVVVLVAFVLFATARSNLAELLVAMAVLGFGVGSFSAAMHHGPRIFTDRGVRPYHTMGWWITSGGGCGSRRGSPGAVRGTGGYGRP
jgi:hypothetical protein